VSRPVDTFEVEERRRSAPSSLKRRLREGEVCLGAVLTLGCAAVAEIFARVGFDWLWIDMEHSSLASADVLALLQAASGTGVSTLVRVAWNDKTMIKQALDLGPDGIIVPQVNTREEAEYAVRAAKYPPWGERGAGVGRAQAYGLAARDYLRHANDQLVTTLMIEHAEAVENIDAILQVEGVDSIMIGTQDLAGSMGVPERPEDPVVADAIREVLAACKKAKRPAGIAALDAATAQERMAQGFTHLAVGMDVMLLAGAARSALDGLRGGQP
jgi:2-keto-3-deoxy-L-rhamnonate aldolase RhmA